MTGNSSQELLTVEQDYLGRVKKTFKLTGWNPFDQVNEKRRKQKIMSALQTAYMLIVNFWIIVGFFCEAIYCFLSVGKPDALLKITNTTPVMGKNV